MMSEIEAEVIVFLTKFLSCQVQTLYDCLMVTYIEYYCVAVAGI